MNKSELKLKLKQIGIDVKESAGKFTKNAMDSSKKMTEKVKIQNKIRKAEKKRKEAYIAIGQKYQELYGNEASPEFIPYLEELADAAAEISSAQAELSALNTASPCPKCGKYVAESQNFCPYCGTKIPKEPIETEILAPENNSVPEGTSKEPETDFKSEPVEEHKETETEIE